MTTGRQPFRRSTPAETLHAIINEELPPLSGADARTPLLLRWIIERCLAKAPEDRYGATPISIVTCERCAIVWARRWRVKARRSLPIRGLEARRTGGRSRDLRSSRARSWGDRPGARVRR